MPLEIVVGTITAADLLTKIDLVLTKAKKDKNASVDLINAEKKATAASSADSDVSINTIAEHEEDTATKPNVEVPTTETVPQSENEDVVITDAKVEPSPGTSASEIIQPSNETKEEPNDPVKESTAELTREVCLQHSSF